MYTLNPDAIEVIMGWLKDDAEGPRALKHQTLLLIADLRRQVVEALEEIIYYAGWLETGGVRAGWWDSRALRTVMDAGDRLVAMGRWERHPDGDGRRQWYRPKVKETT